MLQRRARHGKTGAIQGTGRPAPKRANQGRRLLWLARLLLLAMAINWLASWFDRRIRPVMQAGIRYECAYYANAAFQDALQLQQAEDPDLYDNLYTLEKSEAGEIRAVAMNSRAVHTLEAALTQRMREALAASTGAHILYIPLGVLLGSELWIGPNVPLRLAPEEFLTVTIEDELESAGINQTKLCIKARFTAQLCATLAGYGQSCEVEQEVLLAQVLLAGQVPQGYLGLGTEEFNTQTQ
jgi:sporulation protein YunB